MYGNMGELLNDSETQIRKARKNLRKLYKHCVNDVGAKFVEQSLLKIDLDLLEGLSVIESKDRICCDGVKREPKWVERDKKLSERIAGVDQ